MQSKHSIKSTAPIPTANWLTASSGSATSLPGKQGHFALSPAAATAGISEFEIIVQTVSIDQ